jgi:hypothetical protein
MLCVSSPHSVSGRDAADAVQRQFAVAGHDGGIFDGRLGKQQMIERITVMLGKINKGQEVLVADFEKAEPEFRQTRQYLRRTNLQLSDPLLDSCFPDRNLTHEDIGSRVSDEFARTPPKPGIIVKPPQ